MTYNYSNYISLNSIYIDVEQLQGQQKIFDLQTFYSRSIRPLVISSLVLDKARLFFSYFRKLRTQSHYVKTAEDALLIVEQNCTIDNVHCLEEFVDHCDIKEVKNELENFKKMQEELLEDENVVKNLISKKATCAVSLRSETIEFQLDRSFLHSLKDVRDYLSLFFNEFANSILLQSIHIDDENLQYRFSEEEELLLVKCSAPIHLMPMLQKEATQNMVKLKSDQITLLKVGHVSLLGSNGQGLSVLRPLGIELQCLEHRNDIIDTASLKGIMINF